MNKTAYIITDLIIIAILSLLSFCIFPITDIFVLSYIFLIVAALMQMIPIFISQKMHHSAYKIALHSTFLIYLTLQITTSFLGYIFSVLSMQLIFAVSTVLLLINIAIAVIILQADKHAEKEISKMLFINSATVALIKAKEMTKDMHIADALNDILETVRYSNINSSSETSEIEKKILDMIKELKENILASKTRETIYCCTQVKQLLSERNALCKIYK